MRMSDWSADVCSSDLDAAEPEAESGREHVEADEVVDEAEERHADRLTGGAEQHGAQAADAVREMAPEYPAEEGREEQQRQHLRTARRGESQVAAEDRKSTRLNSSH